MGRAGVTLPAPLTPADADLQDFPFMPLHVARLRDSDMAAIEEPEACWYAVLLWCAAWHQLPAGSLPDNDTVLMRLAGLGRDRNTWALHRNGALRGWVLCSDGRLYHPVVAEQVIEAWESRTAHREDRDSNAERQARWREEQRRMCARLRELGVTPPSKASKAKLLELLTEHDPEHGRNNGITGGVTPERNACNGAVTPKTGTGTGIETGILENDVDAHARADAPDPLPNGDFVQLASAISRVSGLRIDPSNLRFGDQVAIMRSWREFGATDADILAAIAAALETATERVSGLRYFDGPVRQHAARQRNRDNGLAPSRQSDPLLDAYRQACADEEAERGTAQGDPGTRPALPAPGAEHAGGAPSEARGAPH